MDIQQIKIVMLGNSNVGKSSILYRYITGDFMEEIDSTIGANFMGKIITINGKSIKLNI